MFVFANIAVARRPPRLGHVYVRGHNRHFQGENDSFPDSCLFMNDRLFPSQVAIVLIGTVLEREKKSCKAMYETLQLLKNPPKKYLSERGLLNRVIRLELTAADLKREHAIQYNARKIKRFAEEKKKQVAENRRQDSLSRSVREHKSEKSVDDNSQQRVNGQRYVTLPANSANGHAAYSREPASGTRSHRRTSSEVRSVSVRGEWVEQEVRNRRTKRSGSSNRGNSR